MVISRDQRLALLGSGLIFFAVGFLPLFGGFSYEFGLACGLLGPSVAATATALEVARSAPLPSLAFRKGVQAGLLQAALVSLVALVHGARVGFCGLLGQLPLFLFGPVIGILLGGIWGALSGTVATALGSASRARLAAVGFALAAPALGVLVSLLRYYQSPIIFAFDPFVGYFAGTLYDTALDGTERLLSYRAGSAGFGALVFGILHSLTRTPVGSLVWRPSEHPGAISTGVIGGVLSFSVTVLGERLGHFQTEASIREALGHVAVSERCLVVYPSGILKRDAHALARECDAHVTALEAYFESDGPRRITVFLFASAAEKAKLMGARDVYIAKPWRDEIYIQASGFPHPVLGHELAHVVAGNFGQGPFEVAGPLGGWFPDPGRIEGYAEAAANREGEDLSPFEWAKAMRELKLLPPIERVFKLTFLGENASKAYTVAGAFVAWLKETYGATAARDWYGGKSLKQVTDKELAQLEREFHAALDAVKLAPQVMDIARARFDRPAVFGRQCPHQVDEINDLAGQALGRLDPERARELYTRVLALDPGHFGARLGLGSCDFRSGDLGAAKQAFQKLAQDESLPKPARLSAVERLADSELLEGAIEGAARHYGEIAQSTIDEDALRNLDVKRWIKPSMTAEHPARRAIVALLVGDPVLGSDWAVAGAELGRWSLAEPKLGIADYLLGKNYFQRGRWSEGAERLDEALKRELPLPRVKREALRSRLLVACALGQRERAHEVFSELARDDGMGPRRRDSIRRFAQRCGLDLPKN